MAADHLFQVREEEESKFLDEYRAEHFHPIVAQFLFMINQSRRGIHMAVLFRTTRVKRPDEDDWGKFKRVLKYLKRTKYMRLTFIVDLLNFFRW